MGANSSHTKYHDNICNTPPKSHVQLLFDPRSPSDAIARTPIQIDSQVSVPLVKSYNHVMPRVIEPDLSIHEENNENNHDQQKFNDDANVSKGSTNIEQPTLDPTKILAESVISNDSQAPTQHS